jgi:hypothetical protein
VKNRKGMRGSLNPSYRHGATVGGRKTPEYKIWEAMIERCENPNGPEYHRYGARGIRVCAKWRHDFAAFLDDVGPRPLSQIDPSRGARSRGYSLDRFPDSDGDYQPGNVRWATSKEQQRNRTNNVLLTYQGETLCASAWAERIGLNPFTLYDRIRAKWSIERALTTPSRGYRGGPPRTG